MAKGQSLKTFMHHDEHGQGTIISGGVEYCVDRKILYPATRNCVMYIQRST